MTEPIEAGIRGLMHQFREFLVALRLSPGRRSLALLVAATLFAVCATAVAQVRLNAWNGPFYEAIAQRLLGVLVRALGLRSHRRRAACPQCSAGLAT
jgi:ABC-type uncharacterized transport system fused permease/ATPase subunit